MTKRELNNHNEKRGFQTTKGFYSANKKRFNGFIVRYVTKSIFHNLRRSWTIIIAIILAVGLTTSLIMWIETAPRLAINSAMTERAFEIQIDHIVYGIAPNDRLEAIQEYLEKNEPLAESALIVQQTIFLYNLNDRSPFFNIANPPENESDFYISQEFNNGAFLVDSEYLDYARHQFSLLPSPYNNFKIDNNGIVISNRLVSQLEEATNTTLKAGDQIDFAVATHILDPEQGQTALQWYDPVKFYNITINAIYDRKVQRNLLYPKFFPESLGDGIIIPRSLFNKTQIKQMETDVFKPSMLIRVDRELTSKMNIFSVTREIEALAFRIETNSNLLYADTYLDEINQILSNYENAQVIILFVFIPLIILASLFFTTTTTFLLEQRKNEIELLRAKGSSFRNILSLFLTEFILLSVLGVSLGIILGFVITLIIASGSEFLIIDFNDVPNEFISTIFLSWQAWVFSAIFIGLIYIFISIQRTRSIIQELQGEEHIKPSFSNKKLLSNRNFDIIIVGLTIISLIIVLQSDITNRLSIDYQLMGLYLASATIIWFLVSKRLTNLGAELLPQMSRITKILFKAKTTVITMNLIGKRPQIINIMTLITLTISLSTFSAFFAQTIQNNTQKNLDYIIGSDFKIFTEPVSTDYARELEKIDGISAVSAITQVYADLGSYTVTVVGINPKNYFNVCYWSQEPLVTGDSSEDILNGLEEDKFGGIIINDFLASRLKLEVGSSLNTSGLSGSIGSEYVFNIKGILKSAPGVGRLYSPAHSVRGFSKLGGIVLVNQDFMDLLSIKETRIFLIKAGTTTSRTLDTIKAELLNQSHVRQVIDKREKNESFSDFMEIAGVAGILSVDFLLALFIGTIGVGLFYNYIISKRLKEYAILRACGSTKNQTMGIAVSENILIILFGIFFGFCLGTGFAIGFMFVSRPQTITGENIFPLELSVSPIMVFLIIIVQFIVMVLASSIAAMRARDVQVSHLLRNL